MLRFVLTRLSLVVPTFIGMTMLAFFLIRLVPGDPIETLAGERGIDPARHAALIKDYGMDRPLLVQYGLYLGPPAARRPGQVDDHADAGGQGVHRPVPGHHRTGRSAPSSSRCVIGIPAGMLAAVKRNSVLDHGVMLASR